MAGLGLAMVDGIVNQSGGQIAVASHPGRGTTVTVSFPLATPVPARTTVLVVEADDAIRETIVAALPAESYTVVPAHDCEAAAETCQKLKGVVDVVVFGSVPLGAAVSVAIHRLRLIRPAVPIVLLSSIPHLVRQVVPTAPNGLALVRKTFTPAELQAAVQDVLTRSRASST